MIFGYVLSFNAIYKQYINISTITWGFVQIWAVLAHCAIAWIRLCSKHIIKIQEKLHNFLKLKRQTNRTSHTYTHTHTHTHTHKHKLRTGVWMVVASLMSRKKRRWIWRPAHYYYCLLTLYQVWKVGLDWYYWSSPNF